MTSLSIEFVEQSSFPLTGSLRSMGIDGEVAFIAMERGGTPGIDVVMFRLGGTESVKIDVGDVNDYYVMHVHGGICMMFSKERDVVTGCDTTGKIRYSLDIRACRGDRSTLCGTGDLFTLTNDISAWVFSMETGELLETPEFPDALTTAAGRDGMIVVRTLFRVEGFSLNPCRRVISRDIGLGDCNWNVLRLGNGEPVIPIYTANNGTDIRLAFPDRVENYHLPIHVSINGIDRKVRVPENVFQTHLAHVVILQTPWNLALYDLRAGATTCECKIMQKETFVKRHGDTFYTWMYANMVSVCIFRKYRIVQRDAKGAQRLNTHET